MSPEHEPQAEMVMKSEATVSEQKHGQDIGFYGSQNLRG